MNPNPEQIPDVDLQSLHDNAKADPVLSTFDLSDSLTDSMFREAHLKNKDPLTSQESKSLTSPLQPA